MFKEYIKPLIVITVIALFFAGALAFVYNITAPVIDAANEERAFEAMYEVLPGATRFEPLDFEAGEDSLVRETYRTENDVGYVFIAAVKGYSGEIRLICAIDNDGKIIDVKTLSHTETVGIGTIIEDESFLSQFSGTGSNLNGVDTVTGATISTGAFIRAINDVFKAFDSIKQGT